MKHKRFTYINVVMEFMNAKKNKYVSKKKVIHKITYTGRALTAADCRNGARTVFSWSSPSAVGAPTQGWIGCAAATVVASSSRAALNRPTCGHHFATNRECPRAAHTVYWHFWSADS